MPIQYGKSRGFTLVEMSIVLVIIGLIIGGILKGQEVVAGARQKSVINQVNAVRAATNTYFDRYRALPGDDPGSAQINALVVAGNGNGIVGTEIDDVGNIGSNTAGDVGEQYQFFNALMATDLLNGGQVAAVGGTAFGTSALPASPITGAGMTVVAGTANGDAAVYNKTGTWVRIHKDIDTPVAAVSPSMARAIDTQIDDGQPLRGGVRGNAAATCNSASYVPGNDAGCIPLFDVSN